MSVLFATLGFTPQLALAPLRDRAELEEVHVFIGTPLQKEGDEALKVCRATCRTLRKRFIVHRVKGAWDYDALLEAFTKAHASLGGKHVLMNASGGTRVMTVAATIFCFTNGIPMVYYDEYEATRGKEIPLRAFRTLRHLGESQRAVLAYLRDNGSSDMSTLSEGLGLAPSTLTGHVGHLREAGLVKVHRVGKRRIVDAVPEVMKVGLEAAA